MEQESTGQKPKIAALNDLINGTIGDFRQNWKKFAILLIIPMAIIFLFSVISFLSDKYVNLQSWGWPAALAFILAAIILIVAFGCYYILTYISEFLLLADLSQEVAFRNLGQWYDKAKPYFWPIVAISIIYTALAVIGFILLIIPGIIFMVYYCFAIYAVIFEGHRFEGSFGRSRELVKGYWWAIFGRFLAGGAIVYFAYVVIGGIYAAFIWLIAYILHFDALATDDLFTLMYDLLSVFVGLAAGPLTMIYTYRIYKSLRAVKNI